MKFNLLFHFAKGPFSSHEVLVKKDGNVWLIQAETCILAWAQVYAALDSLIGTMKPDSKLLSISLKEVP